MSKCLEKTKKFHLCTHDYEVISNLRHTLTDKVWMYRVKCHKYTYFTMGNKSYHNR